MGLLKSNILCSSPEKSFLEYIAGVISSVNVIYCSVVPPGKRQGLVIPLLLFLPVYLKKEISQKVISL
ncbi:hypothetical protein [Klebsiella pneumoniae]|uniref:hypothetical protein n=1 Tax=Klebsiella pneumoniae TaxID=573 RepID=UPI0019D70527|nr:hypothetical protein [Klebsiella pneumoniae]